MRRGQAGSFFSWQGLVSKVWSALSVQGRVLWFGVVLWAAAVPAAAQVLQPPSFPAPPAAGMFSTPATPEPSGIWPLPAVENGPRLVPSGFPDPAVERATESANQPPPTTSPSSRDGPWQQARWRSAWLSGSDPGLAEQNWDSTWAFPTISRDYPLVLTLGYRWIFLTGPPRPDLPARLHDLTLDVRWICPLGEEWILDVSITPGLHTDFEQETSRAFRLPGRVLLVWKRSEWTKWIVGLTYLDREDVQFLPIAGVVWTPDEDHRLELTVPKPRYAVRVFHDAQVQRWWYVAGEFGGGSWAVERIGGRVDVLNYYDIRLMLGIEQKNTQGWDWFVEAGYVFGRNVDFVDTAGDYRPDDAAVIRAGLKF